MSKIIEHTGRVASVVGNRVDVSILVNEACGSCKAKSACGMMGDGNQREIAVITEDAENYSVGEEVVVSMTQEMGIKAVIYSYIVPFVFMFATLLVMLELGMSETVAGLSSLAVIVIYYVILFLFRKQLSREMVFEVRKNENQ